MFDVRKAMLNNELHVVFQENYGDKNTTEAEKLHIIYADNTTNGKCEIKYGDKNYFESMEREI